MAPGLRSLAASALLCLPTTIASEPTNCHISPSLLPNRLLPAGPTPPLPGRPFCAPTNSLALELGFRSSAIDAREARVKTGAEAEEERARQVDEVAEAVDEPAVQAAAAQGQGNGGRGEGSEGKRVDKDAVRRLDKLSPAERRSVEHRLVDQRAVLGLGRCAGGSRDA